MSLLSNEEQFRRSVEEWLRRNELDGDSFMLTGTEWVARGETLLRGAELVLVTVGALSDLLNYHLDDPKVDELFDLCESFGYSLEIGHAWSVGFYRDTEGQSQVRPAQTYRQMLRDPRWVEKANAVKARAEGRCEDCGRSAPLEAHHCWYRYGLAPWQYPLDCFRSLCRSCHDGRGRAEQHFRGIMARLSTEELDMLRNAVVQLFHWYERPSVHRFLLAIGHDDEALKMALEDIMRNKTEPGARDGGLRR